MFKLFSAFRKDKVWDFNGGIHPPEMKTQSNGTPLRQVSLPQRFVIPLKQHIGAEGELCVQPGDRVLRGQPLTRGWGRMLPVHAPTSGIVAAIAPHSTAHPSALAEMSVIIDADGEDRWIERDGWNDYQNKSREELIERIHQFGVAGLGGAGFPTGTKLRGGGDRIETLIINAAECEPYITADDRLMQDCAAQIVEGIRILAHILQPAQVLIGIEDNKPQAISMLRAVLADTHGISLRVIPTKYPSGGAKQLTQILTGKQVPHGGRSSDIGVLMQNVGTAYAVKRAVIDGEPLTERVVTLTGEAVTRPGNVWARLGTPVSHLLKDAGFCPGADPMVIMGGPLMGFTLPWLDVPVVKITNCLLAPSASEMGEPEEEKGCIRCSACADACPADLLPQQLYWFSKGQQHDKATSHNLADCIECGACAWVCPSNIPLVQYFRQEKAEIYAIAQEEKRAAEAKVRFEARQARLERDKAARLERHKQAAVQPAAKDQDAINAALARVREKQRNAAQPIIVLSGEKPNNSEAIAAREARKAEARARRAEQLVVPAEPAPDAEQPATVDPRKAAVEAAIARAKARKAGQQAAPAEPAPAAEQPATVDPRKAAVEAAIARAKARKAGLQAAPAEPAPAAEQPATVDPRKAAVETAIARAKARKAGQQAAPAEPAPAAEQPATVDPRKAAVEAAIARAKARKAEQQLQAVPPSAANDDGRKAAVAEAIARVQARKASRQAVNED
ncbi:electron transport complex subunit RsxC [Klebsiella oxytoca]|uniref:electron transport complex subunit RsxC n=2 Tax=Klebsiella oxytoca TaxID=571 RepID=UPI0003BF9C1E|nr:electron transport complex subunit RsxC [Klebsiella oxytoca]EGT0045070.1 electron transport complex subunit RsxC [Klebsiella oxytoca]ELP2756743.1 electron transport complex subunit RsxC [Klebsiella oxytoca]ELR0727399.1 electron transport complex subunit RsxC [Klebsiella oxytoca]ESN01033.1 electron transport complex protein rnfC [Klebsiella oxytoca MGH 28]EUC89816.1 electron transport complex, RnfABCDGE type, C subunit [Klebsiella oxytoca OK-1]